MMMFVWQEDDSGLLDRDEVALLVEFFAGDKEVSEEEIDSAMKAMVAICFKVDEFCIEKNGF